MKDCGDKDPDAWFNKKENIEYFLKWYPHFGARIMAQDLKIRLSQAENFAHKYKLKMLPNLERLCRDCRVNRPFKNGDYETVRCLQCLKKKQEDRKKQIISNDPIYYKLKRLCFNIKKRAAAKGYAYDIDPDYSYEIYRNQNGKCFYTGIDMTCGVYAGAGNRDYRAISIDRLNNNKGYEKDNVVLCCFWANTAKYTLRVSTFVEMCRLLINHMDKLRA